MMTINRNLSVSIYHSLEFTLLRHGFHIKYLILFPKIAFVCFVWITHKKKQRLIRHTVLTDWFLYWLRSCLLCGTNLLFKNNSDISLSIKGEMLQSALFWK
jgi:hypothetical protein